MESDRDLDPSCVRTALAGFSTAAFALHAAFSDA